jgi:hypothetical protein
MWRKIGYGQNAGKTRFAMPRQFCNSGQEERSGGDIFIKKDQQSQ